MRLAWVHIGEEYEHTGAPPFRGYEGRRVLVLAADAERVTYVVTRPPPGCRAYGRVLHRKRHWFDREYRAVPTAERTRGS